MWKFIGAGVLVSLLVAGVAWATKSYYLIELVNGYLGFALIMMSSVSSYFTSMFFARNIDPDEWGKPKRPRWYWALGLFLMAMPPLGAALLYAVLT